MLNRSRILLNSEFDYLTNKSPYSSCILIQQSMCLSRLILWHHKTLKSTNTMTSSLTSNTQNIENKNLRIRYKKLPSKLFVRAWMKISKQYKLSLFPLIALQGLKVNSSWWSCHVFQTQDTRGSNWIWPESLLPEE